MRHVAPISRRRFGALAATLVAPFAFGGCSLAGEPQRTRDARLHARPNAGKPPAGVLPGPGRHALGLDTARDAVLQMPARLAATPAPLLVLFHGAGGSADRMLQRFGPAADAAGIALLVPESRGSTWDAIRDSFGADVAFVDRALERVFAMLAVDPARLSAGGFSDGATYALSIGLANGDLFPRVVAYSPGFVIDDTPHGKPRFFVSHGTADPILPIDHCSRVIVPNLKSRGYDVTYREFNGVHEAPADIQRDAMAWLLSQA